MTTKQQLFLNRHPEFIQYANEYPVIFRLALIYGKIVANIRCFPTTLKIWWLRFDNWRLQRKIERMKVLAQ